MVLTFHKTGLLTIVFYVLVLLITAIKIQYLYISKQNKILNQINFIQHFGSRMSDFRFWVQCQPASHHVEHSSSISFKAHFLNIPYQLYFCLYVRHFYKPECFITTNCLYYSCFSFKKALFCLPTVTNKDVKQKAAHSSYSRQWKISSNFWVRFLSSSKSFEIH